MDDIELRRYLGCSAADLNLLRLSRRPDVDSPAFHSDVRLIGDRFAVEALPLIRLLREVASIDAMRGPQIERSADFLMADRNAVLRPGGAELRHTHTTGEPMRMPVVQAPLYGHTSPETAFVVHDYPYSVSLRCRIRYWLEANTRRGFRLVSQTTNPKQHDEWNRPRKSTYALLSAAMYLDEKGHVQWYGLTEYSRADAVAWFVATFPEADLSRVRSYIEAQIRFVSLAAAGKPNILVNNVPQQPSESDITRAREELRIWQSITFPMLTGRPEGSVDWIGSTTLGSTS